MLKSCVFKPLGYKNIYIENLPIILKNKKKRKCTKQLRHQESPIIQINGGFSYQNDSGTI